MFMQTVEMISEASKSSYGKEGTCDILGTLTGFVDRDSGFQRSLQALRSHSINRNVMNNPKAVKSLSTTGISHSGIFQLSYMKGGRGAENISKYVTKTETHRCTILWISADNYISLMVGSLPTP